MKVTVIGAGLAGSECAWQLAQRGIQVRLCEMKPEKMTPAHTTEYFAELCCSNSLRGAALENAVGLLKEELRRLDSLILQCADATRVEAGGALAVDRHGFAKLVTEKIRSHPNITVVPGEVTDIPEGEVIIASGPLTSDALAENMPRAVIHLMEQPCRRILNIFILKIGQYQLCVLRFAALDGEINRQLQFMVQSRNQIGDMSATPEGKVFQTVAVQKQPRI